MSDSINKSKIHCPRFEVCSGCVFNEGVDKPVILKEVRDFFELQGIRSVKVISGPARGWRCRAKLAVRGIPEHIQIGLFKEGSHEVVDIPDCRVHHPNINKALEYVRDLIRSESIQSYQESNDQGILRYLQLVVERSTGRIQLAFVINSATLDAETCELWTMRFEKLAGAAPDLWHSLWLNGNNRRDNVILGDTWWRGWGQEFLWETLGKAEVAFVPGSFGQANLGLFEKILEEIRALVPPNSKVAEYYAGGGVIGLNLVQQCLWLRSCEVNPYSRPCFEASVEKLSPEIRQKQDFHYGSAGSFSNWVSEADVVVVDPPRKGLDEPLLKALTADTVHAKRLIYVSCSWKSFPRHCEALIHAGWTLISASAYVLFPGANYVELVTVFDRVK